MDSCNVESATEASLQHYQAGDPSSGDSGAVLTYLTFLEKKIGYLRGIVCSAPRQVVSAELSCIAEQLVAISKTLGAAKPPPPCADNDPVDEGSYEVVQLEAAEILAPHVHSCAVCGKGFKRDANLRMHMRGHGKEYKALAKPTAPSSSPTDSKTTTTLLYSCPYAGCKRNREHRSFQPLKTAVCVRNHYRRSHCDRRHVCRRCGVKRFSVLGDLRTHEKHCGRDRWFCSCGTSFSRKDKLFAHVAAFDGHAPALPPPAEEDDDVDAGGSDQHRILMDGAAMECFPDTGVLTDGFGCSDIKGFPPLTDGEPPRCLDDDGRGLLSPMGIDSCGFDGLADLFGVPIFEF